MTNTPKRSDLVMPNEITQFYMPLTRFICKEDRTTAEYGIYDGGCSLVLLVATHFIDLEGLKTGVKTCLQWGVAPWSSYSHL